MGKLIRTLLMVIMVLFNSYTTTLSYANEPNIDDILDDGIGAEISEEADEFEGANRAVFAFNSFLDVILLRPLALTYEHFVPQWGRDRIRSVLHNLQEPVFAVNHILQGKPDDAFRNVGRFLTNSTFGVLGIFDVASEAAIMPARTDFGLTLKGYGVKTGPYLVLPLIGSSSVRDAPSMIVDALLDPWQYYNFPYLEHGKRTSRNITTIRYAMLTIDKRQSLMKLMDQLDAASLDKYVMLRSIYLQRR